MKISVIMPVFNEEKLLPYHLHLLEDGHIDEVILVDGGPNGPSTDGTALLAEGFPHVKVVSGGLFEQEGRLGGWDRSAQIQYGVENASGDVVVLTSVDCPYDEYEALEGGIRESVQEGKIWFGPTLEFFIDTLHLRLVPHEGLPWPQIGVVAIRKDVFIGKPGYFDPAKVKPEEMVLLHGVTRYHYGWVTDFSRQVQKHIRNVKSGWWGEYGDSILAGGEQGLWTWAITHVLNYTKEIAYPYVSSIHHPFKQIDFSYMDGFDTVLEQFKEKFSKDYYDCVVGA